MADRERQASGDDDGIEVTPEMVEAGVEALYGFDPGFTDPETAARVYRAMEMARRGHTQVEVEAAIKRWRKLYG
jgi:hypothetical protein